MNERPTPETDAAWACFKGYMEPLQDVKDLSHKLERERDEASELLESEKITRNHIIKRSVEVERERDEAIRQRNETNESSVFSCNFYYEEKLKAERERDEAKELAERMFRERAEALKEIHNQFIEYDKLFDEAEKIRVERDEARDVLEEVSLNLSSGIGDENTTAQQYKERILDGIKHLAGHAWEERCKFEQERDEAREEANKLSGAYEDATNYYARMIELIEERDKLREELENEMKWHHQTHKELVEAQCKLLDIEYDKLKS